MKLRVLTENPITIMEYKRVVDLAKSSKSLETDMYKLFPERCKSVQRSKKAVVIYLDKKDASSHKYEMKFD